MWIIFPFHAPIRALVEVENPRAFHVERRGMEVENSLSEGIKFGGSVEAKNSFLPPLVDEFVSA